MVCNCKHYKGSCIYVDVLYSHSLTLSICIMSGPLCPHHNKPDHTSAAEPMALTAASVTDGCPQCATALTLKDGKGPVRSVASDEAEEGALQEADREDDQSGGKDKGKNSHNSTGNCVGCSPKKQCKELCYVTRMRLWGIVESKYFNRGIMIAILINTISMGIEHHEQVLLACVPLLV